MAKKTEKIDTSNLTFKTGVNLRCTSTDADGERFEAGDAVPADITDAELKALRELDAIEG